MRVRVQQVASLYWCTVCINKLHISLLTLRDRTCHFTIFRVKTKQNKTQNKKESWKTTCIKHFYFLFMKCFINDNKMTFILSTLSICQNAPREIKFWLSISSRGPEGNPVLSLGKYSKGKYFPFESWALMKGVSLTNGEMMLSAHWH